MNLGRILAALTAAGVVDGRKGPRLSIPDGGVRSTAQLHMARFAYRLGRGRRYGQSFSAQLSATPDARMARAVLESRAPSGASRGTRRKWERQVRLREEAEGVRPVLIGVDETQGAFAEARRSVERVAEAMAVPAGIEGQAAA